VSTSPAHNLPHCHDLTRQQVFILLRKHKQGLGLKTCPFKAQGILELSIFCLVFQHPVLPEVDIKKPVWVNGFCPFFPGGLTNFSDIVLSSVRLFTCNLLRMSGFLWRSNLVRPSDGPVHLIFASFHFLCVSLVYNSVVIAIAQSCFTSNITCS
jgi:hypothetical protein